MKSQEEVLAYWKEYKKWHSSPEGQTKLAQCRLDMAIAPEE